VVIKDFDMPQSITDGALAWQRLAVINKHPRDERITFDEETHKYTIDGSRYDISCTGFVHSFFGHFDPDDVIKKMMRSPNWKPGGTSYEKYKGLTAQGIKDLWDSSGSESSEAGTRMHLDIEHYYNAAPIGNLAGDNYEANPGAEWDYFMRYERKWRLPYGFVPYRTEWLVFNEEIRLAGSIDMVYAKPDGTYAIYDWKRTKEIKMENRYQKGLGPLAHLDDCNYWHYSLQLNNYRRLLEKFYGMVVNELALVVIHPVNKSYKIVKLNLMDAEVDAMWAFRLEQMNAPVPIVLNMVKETQIDLEPEEEPETEPDRGCLILDD
jgi:hypothetical protein